VKEIFLASCRADLENEDRLFLKKDYEVFTHTFFGGATKDGSRDGMLKIASKKKVLVLVHGFNSDWEDVIESYFDLAVGIDHLKHYDQIIGFMWPGGDHAWDYRDAARRTKAVGRRLLHLLEDLRGRDAEVDLLGHSMGCRVILNALDGWTFKAERTELLVKRVFLTAPAVDDEDLEEGEKYYKATKCAEKVVVFFSRKDRMVLCWAFKLGEPNDTGCALGFRGPEDLLGCAKNVSAVNCKRAVGGHNKYKNAPEFYRFLNKILSGKKTKRISRL